VSRRVRHVLAAIALAGLLALGFLAATASAATPRTNLPDVEDEVMCTICGTLLAESDSPQAERERALIRRLIDRGETKDQIKDALVAQYGSNVLATPSGHGFDLVAWVVPGVAIVVAAGAIGFFVIRQLRRPTRRAAPAALEPSDEARLDEDMARYDR
jgi:cytochrome c-type biogenesis protein CcmH